MEVPTMNTSDTGFQSTMNKGFRITFDNGWAVSVQWGSFNYCEHHNGATPFGVEMRTNIWHSRNAEVAVFNNRGEMVAIDGGHDPVIGYQTPDDVARIIADIADR
jgi:hypothetical protein